MRFLEAYLRGRSTTVKLGSTISWGRPTGIGFPQGSVLSTTLFDVVMAGVAPALLGDSLISATICTGDVCVCVVVRGYR